MAYAMGYRMSPLTGLRRFRFHYSEFCSELLTQDTSAELPKLALFQVGGWKGGGFTGCGKNRRHCHSEE
jgi:hypothetical protein